MAKACFSITISSTPSKCNIFTVHWKLDDVLAETPAYQLLKKGSNLVTENNVLQGTNLFSAVEDDMPVK